MRQGTYEAASRQDNRLNRWFHESPKPAFRRGKTMKDELVRSKLLTKSVRRLRYWEPSAVNLNPFLYVIKSRKSPNKCYTGQSGRNGARRLNKIQ